MPSKYTSNYQLNQWEPDDAVRRVDFNADNAKIDAAIKAVDARVTSVSGSKASVSALNSLQSTVNSQAATLGHKGNCQVVVTDFTGNGAKTRTHTFPRKPVIAFITGTAMMTIGYGGTRTYNLSNSLSSVGLEWSGNSVTLRSLSTSTSDDSAAIGNYSGAAYQLIALYNQDE